MEGPGHAVHVDVAPKEQGLEVVFHRMFRFLLSFIPGKRGALGGSSWYSLVWDLLSIARRDIGDASGRRWWVPFGWAGLFRSLGAQRPGAPPARRGSSVIGRRFRWNRCRVDPATWVPRRLRRGARLSLEESRRKEHQGQAPGPWALIAARSHSLVFASVFSGKIAGLLLPIC